MSRLKQVFSVMLIVVLAALIAGCGGATTSTETAAEPAAAVEEAAPAAEVEAEPAEAEAEAPAEEAMAETEEMVHTAGDGNVGGTLVAGALSGLEPKSLNPNFRRDDGALRAAALMYCQLVYADFTHGTGIYPELAESWDINDDATEFTFYLVENATWHDGMPLTSADVAWTFNEIIDKEGGAVDFLSGIESIETPDDYTLQITLKESDAAFLDGLGSFYGPKIMPAHLYEGTDWTTNEYNDQPVGCGPFQFVEWQKGSYLEVEANPDYYRGRPLLDRHFTRFYALEGLISAFENGEVVYSYDNFPFSEAERLANDPEYDVDVNIIPLVYWIGFNLTQAPFDDVRVRQAIAYAIDREDISERVFLGYLPPSYGTMPKGWHYAGDMDIGYDPEKAMALLDEAGLTPDEDGVRFETTLTTAAVMSFPEVFAVIQQNLADIGIETDIETMDWAGYVQKAVEQRDYAIGSGGGFAGPDPAGFEPFVVTDGYRNMMGYSNPRVDELFALARSTSNRDERAGYYEEVQQILLDDMPRVTFLDGVSAFPTWASVNNPYFADGLIGMPSNMEYSFLYTYLDNEG